MNKTFFVIFFMISSLICYGQNQTIDQEIKEAKSYYDNGEYKLALIKLNNIINVETNSFKAYYLRGLVNTKLYNDEDAFYDFNQAITLNINIADAFYQRALLSLRLRDATIDAMNDIERSLKLDSTLSSAYHSRGLLRMDMYDYLSDSAYNNSLNDFNLAIKYNQNNAEAYLSRAGLKYKLQDTTGACLDFIRAFELGIEYAKLEYERLCK